MGHRKPNGIGVQKNSVIAAVSLRPLDRLFLESEFMSLISDTGTIASQQDSAHSRSPEWSYASPRSIAMPEDRNSTCKVCCIGSKEGFFSCPDRATSASGQPFLSNTWAISLARMAMLCLNINHPVSGRNTV